MHVYYQPWSKVFSCASEWGKLKIDKLSWRVDYAEDLEKRCVLSLDLNVDVTSIHPFPITAHLSPFHSAIPPRIYDRQFRRPAFQMGPNSGLHIIIFDEIDAICKARGSVSGSTAVHDTVVNQLLSKIDGVDQLNNILVIG